MSSYNESIEALRLRNSCIVNEHKAKVMDNLVPRVSHLTTPRGDKMRDPGNEVGSRIQNIDGTLIPTADMTKIK